MNSLAINEHDKVKQMMIDSLQSQLIFLDSDLQLILIDDLITAFYNRFEVLRPEFSI